jgi:hypothetical protein
MNAGTVLQTTFTVEDRFLIRGRGLILVPGLPVGCESRYRIGDPIVLQRPDGTRLAWAIGGLEIWSSKTPLRPPREWTVPILLMGLEKADVPIGTVVRIGKLGEGASSDTTCSADRQS